MGDGPSDVGVVVDALGPLVVSVDGHHVQLPPAQRRLLSILLVEAGRGVSIDELIDRMWPGRPPSTARSAVQVHVSRLRRAVPVDTTPTGYRLSPAAVLHDRIAFESLVAQSETARVEQRWQDARRLAVEAAALWRGDPYQDLGDSTDASATAVRLRELLLEAADIEVEALLALGQNDTAIRRLHELMDRHPLHDRLRHHLMLALYRSGRQGEALRAFQAYRTLLGETMGIEPGLELRTLEEQILVHDPELGARPEPPTPHNLPAISTSFIGRESEIRWIADALEASRVVSVVGGPGMGKTRLAIESGRALLEKFSGGVWFASLSGAHSERDLVATVSSVASTGDGIRDVESLARAIRSRPILLVLDNCEHLVEQVRRLLLAMTAQPGECRVLATSRLPVTDAGTTLRISPLPIASDGALALMVDRVRSIDRGFAVTPDNARSVSDLCGRLEGVPLAIELVARFVPSFGLLDTSRLLEQVTGADALEAAFRWSEALLPSEDRELLHRLAVFESSFALERAHRVCAGDGVSPLVTAGSVSRLVDASLLVLEWVSSAPRYRMLQPVREEVRRSSDASTRLQRRLAQVIAEAADEIREAATGTRQGEVFATLDAEIADFRSVLGYFEREQAWTPMITILEALSPYWYARFLSWEATAWLALIPLDALEHADRIRVHSVAGFLAWATHDYDAADRHYQTLLAAGQETGDRAVVADALYGRGLIHQKRRFLDGAAMLEEAAAIYEQLDGRTLDLGQCLLFRGLDEAYTGDPVVGEGLLLRARALLEEVGYLRQVSKAERWVAHCRWRRGDEQGAREYADSAERRARMLGDQLALGGALVERATIDITWGDAAAAAGHLHEALAPIPDEDEVDVCQVFVPVARLAGRVGDRSMLASVLTHIDDVYDRHGWRPLDEAEGVAELRSMADGLVGPAEPIRSRVASFLTSVARGTDRSTVSVHDDHRAGGSIG